ncbi:MAG: hypothetical protein WD470_03290 [Rhodospirillaceae bacterium]
MGIVFRYGAPILAAVGIGIGAWVYFGQSDEAREARRAAETVLGAADRALDAVLPGRGAERSEIRYISAGAIFTSGGHVNATLIVRGAAGAAGVCSRMVHVRDYLVVLLSDFPPDPADPSAGPVGFGGSVADGLNELLANPAVERVRFDPYRQGADGGGAGCG